jgi:hypothetical protein
MFPLRTIKRLLPRGTDRVSLFTERARDGIARCLLPTLFRCAHRPFLMPELLSARQSSRAIKAFTVVGQIVKKHIILD